MRVVFALSLPYPTVFLHPSKKLLPAIVFSSHMEEKRSFEEFKGKDTFCERSLRQKGLDKL